jgi:hypothetical protein
MKERKMSQFNDDDVEGHGHQKGGHQKGLTDDDVEGHVNLRGKIRGE